MKASPFFSSASSPTTCILSMFLYSFFRFAPKFAF